MLIIAVYIAHLSMSLPCDTCLSIDQLGVRDYAIYTPMDTLNYEVSGFLESQVLYQSEGLILVENKLVQGESWETIYFLNVFLLDDERNIKHYTFRNTNFDTQQKIRCKYFVSEKRLHISLKNGTKYVLDLDRKVLPALKEIFWVVDRN